MNVDSFDIESKDDDGLPGDRASCRRRRAARSGRERRTGPAEAIPEIGDRGTGCAAQGLSEVRFSNGRKDEDEQKKEKSRD